MKPSMSIPMQRQRRMEHSNGIGHGANRSRCGLTRAKAGFQCFGQCSGMCAPYLRGTRRVISTDIRSLLSSENARARLRSLRSPRQAPPRLLGQTLLRCGVPLAFEIWEQPNWRYDHPWPAPPLNSSKTPASCRRRADWLIENLLGEEGLTSDEAFAAWQKEAGEPEPGYDGGSVPASRRRWRIPQATFPMKRP